MERLRFATVGSVDDGKSTLIGRLLYDSKSIFEDQLEHIEAVSKRRGDDYVDLSLLTDGLRAEREQGITIDVAYRYFATPKRSFIIADCPGHIQYTRNMITGASNVDLAIVLIDARTGVIEQTRRHSLLVSLLGVPHLVICVNKMDLVDYDQEVFNRIREEFEQFASRLDLQDVTFLPISALAGDNCVTRSTKMNWYEGPTLLHHLENVYTASDDNRIDTRFPVQFVIRPQRADFPDYRGYAGRVAGGVLRVGDEVMVLPSGLTSTITGIDSPTGPLQEATPGQAVTVLLAIWFVVITLKPEWLARGGGVPGVVVRLPKSFAKVSIEPGNRVRAGAGAMGITVASKARDAFSSAVAYVSSAVARAAVASACARQRASVLSRNARMVACSLRFHSSNARQSSSLSLK